MGNFKRFLSTVAAEASYLQYCIIEPYVDEVNDYCFIITFLGLQFWTLWTNMITCMTQKKRNKYDYLGSLALT